jgi:hypothetical protein
MGLAYGNPLPENKRDYAVGRGKPPVTATIDLQIAGIFQGWRKA